MSRTPLTLACVASALAVLAAVSARGADCRKPVDAGPLCEECYDSFDCFCEQGACTGTSLVCERKLDPQYAPNEAGAFRVVQAVQKPCFVVKNCVRQDPQNPCGTGNPCITGETVLDTSPETGTTHSFNAACPVLPH